MDYFPLFMRLGEGRRILIVGGGAVALGKAESLSTYRESLHVVAEKFSEPMQRFLDAEHIAHNQSSYAPSQLEGISLVIAATNNAELNRQILADAKTRNIPVNVVDQPELCDVIFPAIVRRGPLQIAISTSGISPVLARLVKQRIEKILPWRFEELITFAQTRRSQVKQALSSMQSRRLFWHKVLEGPVAAEVLEGNEQRAANLFAEQLEQNDSSHAALYLIGAGPGDPELLTVKAIRLLSMADVILHDRLVAPDILAMYARKEAVKQCVGKTKGMHLQTQESINELIDKHLRAGKIVVRLKGGDPSIYAHGAEEIAIAKELNVPYQIVPGITAATGCAAAAGIPLTERGGAQALRFLTLYQEQMDDPAFWESLKHARAETLVFYMATAQRGVLCRKLMELGFAASLPILAIEQGTTPAQREYEGTLADFDTLYASHTFASPTLLIVGEVVRWRKEHGWKEIQEQARQFFPALMKEAA